MVQTEKQEPGYKYNRTFRIVSITTLIILALLLILMECLPPQNLR